MPELEAAVRELTAYVERLEAEARDPKAFWRDNGAQRALALIERLKLLGLRLDRIVRV